jgi:hypothetical protein
MLSDIIVRFIRTYVPIGVGLIVGWLALPDSVGSDLTAALTPVFIAAYYAIAALLEKVHPIFGWLLGVPKDKTIDDREHFYG